MVGEPLSGTISPFITGNENTEFSTARPACIRKIKADPTTTVNMNLKKGIDHRTVPHNTRLC